MKKSRKTIEYVEGKKLPKSILSVDDSTLKIRLEIPTVPTPLSAAENKSSEYRRKTRFRVKKLNRVRKTQFSFYLFPSFAFTNETCLCQWNLESGFSRILKLCQTTERKFRWKVNAKNGVKSRQGGSTNDKYAVPI